MTGEFQPRIAIVLSRDELSSFFAMEARSCGCLPVIRALPPTDLSTYHMVLIDPRIGYCMADGSDCLIVALVDGTSGRSPSWAQQIWEWPISIHLVHKAFEQLRWKAKGEPTQPSKDKNESKKPPRLYWIAQEEKKVLYYNRTIALTPCEAKLLQCLSKSFGQVVEKEALQEVLGSRKGNPVEVHLCNLRRKLGAVSDHVVIETKRGRGYLLRIPLENLL